MKTLKIIALICLMTVQLSGQTPSQQKPFQSTRPLDQISIGIGGGFDYGGFGGNLMYYPVKSVALFGGVGYAAGLGLNAGLKFRIVPKKPDVKFHPYGMVMYGYNAAITVANMTHLNRLFYGPTLGLGFDFHGNPMKRGYWSFAVFVPIRKSEVFDYMDSLESNYGVEFPIGLLPVTGSIGYRFIIK